MARPDENFAREVMQLFSIGVYLLNIDGTLKVSPSTGLPIPTYRNTDIETFARAWTGVCSSQPGVTLRTGIDILTESIL